MEKMTTDLLEVVIYTEPGSVNNLGLCGRAVLPLPKTNENPTRSQHVLLIDCYRGHPDDSWLADPTEGDVIARLMLILRVQLFSNVVVSPSLQSGSIIEQPVSSDLSPSKTGDDYVNPVPSRGAVVPLYPPPSQSASSLHPPDRQALDGDEDASPQTSRRKKKRIFSLRFNKSKKASHMLKTSSSVEDYSAGATSNDISHVMDFEDGTSLQLNPSGKPKSRGSRLQRLFGNHSVRIRHSSNEARDARSKEKPSHRDSF